MTRWKKIAAWILAVLLALLIFMTWYRQTYSMKTSRPFEVNSPTAPDHVLIATQGSRFKDSVVNEIVNELKSKQVYISVIDVSDLATINEAEWTAIVILHTWEYGKPPEDVNRFVEQTKDKRKLIVLSTSGQGSYRIEGVDGITSASKLSDASGQAKELTERVTRLLTTGE